MGKERSLIQRIFMEEDLQEDFQVLIMRILENVVTVCAVRLVWKVIGVVIVKMKIIIVIVICKYEYVLLWYVLLEYSSSVL
jgi:hypothetical protein